MSTIFIAVQCCQCSTMQVKQRKKSSNKWNCVVCNQNQSVLKVFAQAFMAKDVRKFVQTFNMSRQFAERNQSIELEQQTLDSSFDEAQTENRKKKRADWTEYIDPEKEYDEDKDNDKSGDVLEPMIVTEMPKAVFKKPKLRNYSASSGGLDTRKSNEEPFRPVFGKTNFNKQLDSLEQQPSKPGGPMVNSKRSDYARQDVDILTNKGLIRPQPSKDKTAFPNAVDNFAEKEQMRGQLSKDMGASKWRDYITQEDSDENDSLAEKAPWQRGATAIKGATSKWNEYITEDGNDDESKLQSGEGFEDHMGKWNSAAFHIALNDQTVEDHIHPDFQ